MTDNANHNALSPRLIALLRHAKASDADCTWKGAATALTDLYVANLTLLQALHHLLAAFEEARSFPGFCIPKDSALEDLVLAPVKGFYTVEPNGPANLFAAYTVEQIYAAMCAHLMGILRTVKVDWCRDRRGS